MVTTNVGEFNRYLLENKLEIHEVIGDGNCLFHCFASFLNNLRNSQDYSAVDVRKSLVDCMRFHRNGTLFCIYKGQLLYIMVQYLFN